MSTKLKIAAILLLYAALNLPFLTVFPPVDNAGDESWMMNISLELLKSGRPVASIFPHTALGEEVQITTVWIYSGILSGILFLTGPEIWAGRLLSFFCGLFVVVLTYFFGRDLGGKRCGLIAAFLLTTSLPFSWHSREMRPDMMLLAVTTLSVYLFYRAQKNGENLSLFLSGLCSTVSVEVHPNGVVFAFALLLVFVLYYGKGIRSRSTLCFFSGLFIGFSAWLAFNFFPFSASLFETAGKHYKPPLLKGEFFEPLRLAVVKTLNIRWLGEEYFSRIGNAGMGIVYGALLLMAAVFLSGRERKNLGFLLLIMGIPLLSRYFFTGTWNWFHYSVFLSFFFLALSLSLHAAADLIRQKGVQRLFLWGVTAAIAVVGAGDIMGNNLDMRRYDHARVMREVSAVIPRGTTVFGQPFYFPAFAGRDDRYVSYLFLRGQCPDFSNEMKSLRIEYVLADADFEIISSRWCSEQYLKNQIVPFLEKQAVFKGSIGVNYPHRYAAGRIIPSVQVYKVKPEFLSPSPVR